MENNAFQELKDICHDACHERHACTHGFKEMMTSENVGQMMGTWRRYWDDLTNSIYVDVIRKELPAIYEGLKVDMNKAGIYLNECPSQAPQYVRVIVTDREEPVKIFGEAQCYVLGAAKVIAFGRSRVYNNSFNAHVMLYEYSYGKIMAGKISAYNNATVQGNCEIILHDRTQCDAFGGTVKGIGYLRINAYNDTRVNAISSRCVNLYGNATYSKLELNKADK